MRPESEKLSPNNRLATFIFHRNSHFIYSHLEQYTRYEKLADSISTNHGSEPGLVLRVSPAIGIYMQLALNCIISCRENLRRGRREEELAVSAKFISSPFIPWQRHFMKEQEVVIFSLESDRVSGHGKVGPAERAAR